MVGPGDFEWLKNTRYYWEADVDSCVVCMSNSRYLYNYEYLGASTRLVITPLTVITQLGATGRAGPLMSIHYTNQAVSPIYLKYSSIFLLNFLHSSDK